MTCLLCVYLSQWSRLNEQSMLYRWLARFVFSQQFFVCIISFLLSFTWIPFSFLVLYILPWFSEVPMHYMCESLVIWCRLCRLTFQFPLFTSLVDISAMQHQKLINIHMHNLNFSAWIDYLSSRCCRTLFIYRHFTNTIGKWTKKSYDKKMSITIDNEMRLKRIALNWSLQCIGSLKWMCFVYVQRRFFHFVIRKCIR